jgi:hypothetical protein
MFKRSDVETRLLVYLGTYPILLQPSRTNSHRKEGNLQPILIRVVVVNNGAMSIPVDAAVLPRDSSWPWAKLGRVSLMTRLFIPESPSEVLEGAVGTGS